MLRTILVVIIGFLPSLFSLWLMRKTQERSRSHLRRVATINSQRRQMIHSDTGTNTSDRYYIEGVGYLIGDISCQYNARSGYLRCAVNPTGPCAVCRYYQPMDCEQQSS
ncbi:DUF6464 family protein [Calothrix sp. 336/3]|uniref:DUF6464 family protein n=1 Tax=Calothrix sp. 336/3 TaxID=1337936 RepID=UPI00055800F0|nr:DUF6464 family protein [Calothrix sp. 336/3]AKG24842.1 hypothetical protein IJ00_25290 [Calothrix sp. 336/3]